MLSVMYPARKENVDDSGFSRTHDRLLGLCGLCVQQSEVWETMIGARGPYNLGSFAIAGIGAHTWICYDITFENFKTILQFKKFLRVTN